MPGTSKKNFDSADETRNADKAVMEIVHLGGVKAGRATFSPGWKWSECIKPVVGGDTCQVHHVGAALSGHMHVVHQDGTELDIGPGDAYEIAPGHDAWVVGDEPYVGFEFDQGAVETYAKP